MVFPGNICGVFVPTWYVPEKFWAWQYTVFFVYRYFYGRCDSFCIEFLPFSAESTMQNNVSWLSGCSYNMLFGREDKFHFKSSLKGVMLRDIMRH
jgi:hypothetical protein